MFEDSARLCAEHEEPSVEKECRDAGDADGLSLCGGGEYAFLIGVARDHLGSLFLVEAGFDRECEYFATVADVARFFPVGSHEAIVYVPVQAALPRELGQAQCSPRIRADIGGRVVDQPDAANDCFSRSWNSST